MTFLIIIAALVIPIIMLVAQLLWRKLDFLYTIVAVISAYIFGIISALAIYRIIRDQTVFMTSIHGIFLNPWFLISGAYLGNYGIYLLIIRLRTAGTGEGGVEFG